MKKLLLIAVLLAGCEKPANDAWQGYIEGEFVLLASPYAGQLEKLHVRRGDSVEAGRPLFALEAVAERAAHREAAERLKSAEARLENLQAGRRPSEIEALRAEIDQAKAARELSLSSFKREEKLMAEQATSRSRHDEARSA
ncbi:MAG: secretion protein HlyD, partial [Betaproteobacteria bacterium]